MADFVLDRLTGSVRIVFIVKALLNLTFGVETALAGTVTPAWFFSGFFLAAAGLNLYVSVILRPTRAVPWALALSIGSCLVQAAGVIYAASHGGLTASNAQIALGVTKWVALAVFGFVATIGASQHLGSNRARGGE